MAGAIAASESDLDLASWIFLQEKRERGRDMQTGDERGVRLICWAWPIRATAGLRGDARPMV